MSIPEKKPSMFLVVDAQNLFHSARGLFGRGARIDFQRLRSYIVGDRSLSGTYSVAIIPEMREESQTLPKALLRLGYEVLTRSDHFEEQVRQLQKVIGSYSIVTVASGDSAFAPFAEYARQQGKTVEVFSFADALSASLTRTVERVEYLGVKVLLGEFTTLEAITHNESETEPTVA